MNYWKSPFELWRAVLTKTRITAAFCKEVPLSLELFSNGDKIDCDWKSANGKQLSVTWSAEFEQPLQCDHFADICLKFEKAFYKLKSSSSRNKWVYIGEIASGNHNNPKLHEQLENYQKLLEMEPNNKWAQLTSTYLMLNINPISSCADIKKELSDLITVDSLRANYYKDMRKYISMI